MKIIEIRNTVYGEVAYVFDEVNQRVIKLPVDDFTGYNEVEEEIEKPVYPRRKRRPKPMIKNVEITEEVDFENLPNEQEKVGPVRPKIMPKKTIIPASLQGVFRQPGQPGAAVETRQL